MQCREFAYEIFGGYVGVWWCGHYLDIDPQYFFYISKYTNFMLESWIF